MVIWSRDDGLITWKFFQNFSKFIFACKFVMPSSYSTLRLHTMRRTRLPLRPSEVSTSFFAATIFDDQEDNLSQISAQDVTFDDIELPFTSTPTNYCGRVPRLTSFYDIFLSTHTSPDSSRSSAWLGLLVHHSTQARARARARAPSTSNDAN